MENKITIDKLAADESFQNWVSNFNKADCEKWNAWIKIHPELLFTVEEAKTVVRLIQSLRKKEILHRKKDVILKDILDKISAANVANSRTKDKAVTLINPVSNFKYLLIPFQLRWVAIFILTIASAGMIYYYLNLQKFDYRTSFGENKSFTLPDGSVINLNANSQLTIKKTWNSTSSREVWLNGEAFFSVKHTPSNQRFIVHTANGDVEVLGTTFNVYNRLNGTRVVLTSGKVKIVGTNPGDSLLLQPGEMADLSFAAVPVKKTVNTDKYISWKNNILLFDNSPLIEVGNILHDKYGYEIVWENERLQNIKFTYRMDDVDIDLLLTTIMEALEIKIEKKDKTLYISYK